MVRAHTPLVRAHVTAKLRHIAERLLECRRRGQRQGVAVELQPFDSDVTPSQIRSGEMDDEYLVINGEDGVSFGSDERAEMIEAAIEGVL